MAHGRGVSTHDPSVGASLLAMDVNDDEGCLNERGAFTSIASKLAPTDQEEKISV